MVVENLTQRSNEFREELDNLLVIRKHIRSQTLSDQLPKTQGKRTALPFLERNSAICLTPTPCEIDALFILPVLSRVSNCFTPATPDSNQFLAKTIPPRNRANP